MSKKCSNCLKMLDDSMFSKNLRNKDGLHSYCKTCNALKAKQYNKKHPEAQKKSLEKQKQMGYFKYGYGAWSNMKRSAEKRGIIFLLTIEELESWWLMTEQKCHYCGNPIDRFIDVRNYIKEYTGTNRLIYEIQNRVFKQKRFYRIEDFTIDRKNSFDGYTLNNIVKSCWICNSIKSNNVDEETMKDIGKQIYIFIDKLIEGEIVDNEFYRSIFDR